MGLLTEGKPMEWDELKEYSKLIRERGIEQFLSLYKRNKGRKDDSLTWGDEIEYYVVKLDHKNKLAYLNCVAHELLPLLQKDEEEGLLNGSDFDTCWRPEYANFMIEGTPGLPYTGELDGLLEVEKNMNIRRERVLKELKDDQTVISLSSFFSLGNNDIKHLDVDLNVDNNIHTNSNFVPDEMINPHPRYASLCKNIRLRKGSKPTYQIPIYKDKNTSKELLNESNSLLTLDSAGIGASCCCLQVTFQCPNFNDATYLYDSLIPIVPIMLSLSAATPSMKGYLTDLDTRYQYLRYLSDCRKDDEPNPKTRYDSSSTYISYDGSFNKEFNDIKVPQDEHIKKILKEANINANLSNHLADVFNNDPLLFYMENIYNYDKSNSNVFDGIQSSVWQTVRFKLPTPDSKIGWRVEFRPMEVQLTDFENAAYAIFINLLVRAILLFRPNFYMPISKVDNNIELANKIDAINQQLFLFNNKQNQLEPFTINQIMNGNNKISGLIPLVQQYLKQSNISNDLNIKLQAYIQFISDRASGKLLSGASYLRQNILNHPDYLKDSLLNNTINFDLINLVDKLGKKNYHLAPQLLGKYYKITEN